MKECERASLRVAIKKAHRTDDLQAGARSIYAWANVMKDRNVDIENVILCYRKYIKKKEKEKQKVLEWTKAMQKRVYYFYSIYSKDDFWIEAKFCVDYLVDRLEDIPNKDNIYIRRQDNQRVLKWINDKIVYTTPVHDIKSKKLTRCKESLQYLKKLLLKMEDYEYE